MKSINCYTCIVKGCSNKVTDNKVAFFQVPKSKEKRKLWLENVQRIDLLDPSYLDKKIRICEMHFDEKSFGKHLSRGK